MRVVNVGIFLILFGTLFVWIWSEKKSKNNVFRNKVKRYRYVFAILLVANSISFSLSFQENISTIILSRDSVSGNEREVRLILENGAEQYPMDLELQRQQLSKEQLCQKMDEAFSYLGKHMKGENQKLSHITTNLQFDLDYEMYPFEMQVIPDEYMLMNEDGVIRNEPGFIEDNGYSLDELNKGIHTGFVISLFYNQEEVQRHYDITIFPKQKTDSEKLFEAVVEKIKKEEKNSSGEKELLLPTVIDGVTVSMKKTIAKNPAFILFLGFLFSGLLALRDMEIKRKTEKQREDNLRKCYPRFVNEMVLLLGAGMQVRNIFHLLIHEYESDYTNYSANRRNKHFRDEREPLIKELKIARQNMEMGMSEEKVYYQLGRRLKLGCYIKLMSLLEQNVKKGAKGLAFYFEQEEQNALEERKNLAKKCGEEAGTKLLGPMMLQLFVVMLIIMVPALMSF